MSKKPLNFIWTCLFVLAFLTAGDKGYAAEPEHICTRPVQTQEGPVIGAPVQEGRACVYKGIPYAAPPLGKLRFRPPEPPAERESALKALEFAPECMQRDEFSWTAGGSPVTELSEDCLYLNIWRPAREGRFPVLVFIHGGWFVSGSGARPSWQGDRLAAQKDLVVVTINYRLGAFGFLALPALAEEDPDNSTGNYGLMDQVRALEWIKNNIHGFGGDPWRITVAGSGAGASSVCALLTSPAAQGLIHRAIMQSGGCRASRVREDAYRRGEELARKLGCSGASAPSCLRNKPAEKIVKATPEKNDLRDWFDFAFLPVEDGHVVLDTPLSRINEGDYYRVPVIVGSNRNEAHFLTLEYPGLRLAFEFTMRRFMEDILGEDGLYGLDHFYTLSHYRRPADQALHAFGDLVFGCPALEAAEALSRKQESVYYYSFDYDEHMYTKMVGAARGFEVPFIFDTLDRKPHNLVYAIHQRDNARPLIDVMTGFWTRLAAKGDPNHPSLPLWPAYQQERRQKMYLDLPAFAIHTDNMERCRYWRQHGLVLNQQKED
ncbi:MAG: carboxylesterase/lipase family protein [bacterium]